MEKTHDENCCSNCIKRKEVHIDAFTGRPVCLDVDVADGDIICTNFVEEDT